MDALKRIAQSIADPETIRVRWAEMDRLIEPDDVMWIEYGEPDPARLARVSDEYEAKCAAPFPESLRGVWQVYDGIAITSDFEERFAAVQPGELVEPALWSAGLTSDHYLHIDSDRMGDAIPFAFASLPDQGVFVLEAFPDNANPRVFWIDDSPHHAPHFVAEDFDSFAQNWCDCALNLPELLRRAAAPGWG